MLTLFKEHPMRCASRLLAILLLLGLAFPLRAAEQESLEERLMKLAPELVQKFQAQGQRNVGVLKFTVKLGRQPITDHAGSLNTRLADKVEMALILASKPHDPKHLGIIHNASATAATIPGASHLTAAGRPRLFEKQYPLAWGKERVTPDVFVTGIVAVDANLHFMRVHLQAFDKNSKDLENLGSFDVPVDLEQLLDIGESFTVRGVFDRGNVEFTSAEQREQATDEAIKTSLTTKAETEKSTKPSVAKLHPLAPENTDSPVALEVRYDNKPQKIEFRNGGAFLPEPKENQVVTLVVRRRGADRPRLGVVLKVNGESTLLRERSDDTHCTPWVFETNLAEFGIRGYYDDHGFDKFKVLSSAASKSREIDYGADVGLISISVFPEETTLAKTKPTVIGTDDKQRELAHDAEILKQNKFPTDPTNNLDALRSELAAGFSRSRGIIIPGEKQKAELERVPFTPASIPLMSGSIRYYSPQDLPK